MDRALASLDPELREVVRGKTPERYLRLAIKLTSWAAQLRHAVRLVRSGLDCPKRITVSEHIRVHYPYVRRDVIT